MRRSELQRKTPLRRTTLLEAKNMRGRPRRAISPATPAQRARVKDQACIVFGPAGCWCDGPVQPAHLIDRSLAPAAGDHPLAVVPLCARHHVLYDDHKLDLSPYLEPHWRESVAWAVGAVGLFGALKRITGTEWAPVKGAAA
jgi:hypothetical protein